MCDILSQAQREPGRGPHSRQAGMEGQGGPARQAGGRVLLPPRLGTGLPRPSWGWGLGGDKLLLCSAPHSSQPRCLLWPGIRGSARAEPMRAPPCSPGRRAHPAGTPHPSPDVARHPLQLPQVGSSGCGGPPRPPAPLPGCMARSLATRHSPVLGPDPRPALSLLQSGALGLPLLPAFPASPGRHTGPRAPVTSPHEACPAVPPPGLCSAETLAALFSGPLPGPGVRGESASLASGPETLTDTVSWLRYPERLPEP